MISMYFYSYPCIMLKELDNLKKKPERNLRTSCYAFQGSSIVQFK